MNKTKRSLRLQPKLLLGLVIMAAILILALIPVVSNVYRKRMEAYYSDLAFQQASIAAQLIDGDRIERYYTSGVKDDYYHDISSYLRTVKQEMGLKYFYIVVPEDKEMVYIWDAGVSGEEGVCDLLDRDAYYGGGDVLMHEAFAVDAPRTILVTNNDEYGYLASAYVAIVNRAGTPVALASVDVSMDMINEQITNFVYLIIGTITLVLLVSVVAYYFYIKGILIKPLKVLHHATSRLVQNNVTHLDDFQVSIKTNDELQDLSDAFQFMVVELKDYIANLAQVTAEKERIGAELSVAAKIQADMLPCIFPAFPDRTEFDVYATMTPAKEVGGDFYDFFLVDEDHLALVMADVSGKGVPAALFMMISKTLIKSAAQAGLSPKEVLEKVNNQLCENNEAEMFVTVWLGILTISTGIMRCANAGHEYPVIQRQHGGFELLKDKHGFVLAGLEGSRYREYEISLTLGDRLFVYTDGVPEATNLDNELYGTDRMLDALNREHNISCADLLHIVHTDIDQFVGNAQQFDDITMLCLEIREKSHSKMKTQSISPALSALGQATSFFEDLLVEAGITGKEIARINIAVDEIFSNIAQYSQATTAILGCEITEQQITLQFSDNGIPYDPTSKEDPDTTLSAEEREIGGLGIYMVKQMMTKMQYEYKDGFNVLTIVKNR